MNVRWPAVSRRWHEAMNRMARVGLWLLVALVLAAGFVGWLQPDMLLAWESVAALCGF